MERRLAAIVSTDVVGYSRLMGADEADTLTRMKAHRRELWTPVIEKHGGRVVGTAGDSLLVEFSSAVSAVESAIEVQKAMAEREAEQPDDKKMLLRIGVNIGEVVVDDDDDIFGDGVNVAARLQEFAEPGGVSISRNVNEQIVGKLEIAFDDAGEHEFKNIAEPVHVWNWSTDRVAGDREAPVPSETLALPDKPSIAVLPFDNMSGDPEQEYFSDGITEDIITGLSHVRGIFVIARNSAFTYKGRAVDVKRVGQDLGVRYVVEGSVRRGGDRVRVTAQLVDSGTGVHVWANHYDGTLDDVFALQDDITAKVITAIAPEITLAEIQRARSKRGESFNAWDLYLQALQAYYAVDKAGYEEATALLEEAIELDPRFSTAYATLARCHVIAGFHGWGASAREVISKAEKFARQAVALDEQDPFAHLALGQVLNFNSEPSRAVNELNRALELDPNLSIAHGLMSNALAFLGRSEDALAAAERANRGSPRDPERNALYTGIMNAHFAAERYEECVEAAEQAVLLQRNFFGGHFVMAMALPYLGQIEEAKQALQRALELMPRLTLKSTARNPMFVRENDVARMLEGLRRAGLPE